MKEDDFLNKIHYNWVVHRNKDRYKYHQRLFLLRQTSFSLNLKLFISILFNCNQKFCFKINLDVKVNDQSFTDFNSI